MLPSQLETEDQDFNTKLKIPDLTYMEEGDDIKIFTLNEASETSDKMRSSELLL